MDSAERLSTEVGAAENGAVLVAVVEQVRWLQQRLIDAEVQWAAQIAGVDESNLASAVNLAHYWAIRQSDLRDLQQQLAAYGLSSLGRCEPHVQATLQAIASTVDALTGQHTEPRRPVAGFVDGPLVLFASQVGVYGVGAVAALIAASIAHCVRLDYRHRPNWLAPIGLSICLCAAALGSGVVVDAFPSTARSLPDRNSAGQLQIALLQGNIPQDEKFVPGGGIASALTWYGSQLRDATASLVVTPETALPLLPAQLPPGYLEAIATRYTSGTQAAIVGMPLGDGGGEYSNSVVGFRPDIPGDANTQNWRYDKHHLVPFGEFVPGVFRWFTNMMRIPLGDFRRGGLAQAPFVWQGQRIAVNICYEDLFGEEIGANFKDEAGSPTVLLNVSNIAWFGDSIAIDQHLAISRMRSLEFQRPMLRATNTGATVVIDHHGRVTQSLPRLTRGVLVAEVEGRYGRTLYARWVARFGLWPLWGAALLIVAVTVMFRLRRPFAR